MGIGMKTAFVPSGGLEDIGYRVNYNAADPYSARLMNPSCKCSGRTRNLATKGHSDKRKLSEAGQQAAVEYGNKHLYAMRKHKESMSEESRQMYMGDQFVSVLYAEEGEIYGVEVWGEEE